METYIGKQFKDRSSGLFTITSIKEYRLTKHYVIKITQRPKNGEPTIAIIDKAISSDEFLVSVRMFRRMVEL